MQPSTPTPNAPQGKEAERLSIISLFVAVSLAAIPIYVYVYHRFGYYDARTAMLVSAPFLLATFLFRRIFKSSLVAANWIVLVGYCLFIAIALSTGGLDAPALTWSVCLPILATLLCGWRSGLVWLVLVIAQLTGFYWLHQHGILLRRELESDAIKEVFYITVVGLTCFTFVLAVISEHYKNKYLRKIEESHKRLEEALASVKLLSGLLPICAWCKKIRNDKGYWAQIETYVSEHTDATFTHGICPACEHKIGEDLDKSKTP